MKLVSISCRPSTLLTRALTAEYDGKSNPGMVVRVFHSGKKDTFDNKLRAAGLLEASHSGDDNSKPLILMKKKSDRDKT